MSYQTLSERRKIAKNKKRTKIGVVFAAVAGLWLSSGGGEAPEIKGSSVFETAPVIQSLRVNDNASAIAATTALESQSKQNTAKLVTAPYPKEWQGYLSRIGVYSDAMLKVPLELRGNEKFMLAAVQQGAFTFFYASEELRSNESFVLTVVRNNGGALGYASDELRDKESVVMAAVLNDGTALRFASRELQGKESVVMAAVLNNGGALWYASDELRDKKSVAMAAVQANGDAVGTASKRLRNNESIAMAAVQQSEVALWYVSSTQQKNPKVFSFVTKKNSWAFFANKITVLAEGMPMLAYADYVTDGDVLSRVAQPDRDLLKVYKAENPNWKAEAKALFDQAQKIKAEAKAKTKAAAVKKEAKKEAKIEPKLASEASDNDWTWRPFIGFLPKNMIQ